MAGNVVMMLIFITAVVVVGIFVMIITPIRVGKVIMVRFLMRFGVTVCDHNIPRGRSRQ